MRRPAALRSLLLAAAVALLAGCSEGCDGADVEGQESTSVEPGNAGAAVG